ncbi:MAG: alpha/beta hydrolase [Deltaproteobacteria bacterium]|nr:alpha/beta hydrolase [Deltaproteobacteria bacterium]
MNLEANAQKTIKNRGKLAQLIRLKEGFVPSVDGTKIYYKSMGWGLPIICNNGMGVSTFFWKYLENHFKHQFQVITWDYRGHGLSELPHKSKPLSVLSLVEDCKAVVDALDVKKALFIGHSIGLQVLLEFYHHYPEYVAGIVSCMGTMGRPMDSFYNSPLSVYIFEAATLIGSLFPKQGAKLTSILLKNPFWFEIGGLLKMVNTGMAPKKEVQKYIDHITSLDPEFFTKLTKSIQSHTAEYILKKLRVPTLIVGGEEDYFTPVWIAKKMHRIIQESELFVIKKGSHAALVEQPELINLRIEKFLKEKVLPYLQALEVPEEAPKVSKAKSNSKSKSRKSKLNKKEFVEAEAKLSLVS